MKTKEEKIKMSLKVAIIISIFIILLISIILIVFLKLFNEKNNNYQGNFSSANHFHVEKNNGKEYYIIDDEYTGECQVLNVLLTNKLREKYKDTSINGDDWIEDFETKKVMSYKEYSDYFDEWGLEKKYSNKDSNYIVFSHAAICATLDVKLAGVTVENNIASLYIWDDESGVLENPNAYVIVIPITNSVNDINIQETYELLDYHTMIGENPATNKKYSYEENAIMAKNAYIDTDNDDFDTIFNKMLEEIVKKHTIEIECSDNSYYYADLVDSVAKNATYKGSLIYYIGYNESYSKSISEGLNEYETGPSRDFMLFDIALNIEWTPVLIRSSKEKNPYDLFDEDYKERKFEAFEDENYYILKFTGLDDSELYTLDEYYINKQTFLLEKTIMTHDNKTITSVYSYSDQVIEIPQNLLHARETFYAEKPIIYLYPEKTTEVSVKLGKPENLTCSYPQYNENGWNVIANPDGSLIDKNTGRSLYSLYWEGNSSKSGNFDEGFVVKREDTISFLEEKLKVLGLNERESEEFIVYWLPRLQNNKYNLIRFETMDEINKNMPIEFSVQPDSVIRVMMDFKALDAPINIKEQILNTPKRTGFTVVEWGGTEINNQ